MKVAIAGAGAVGRSIARELIENGHEVTLLERNPDHVDVDAIPAAHWRLGEAWGVDVAVSTPRMLASLVEEAVAVGDLVHLMEFRTGQASLIEITLPVD